MRYLARPFLSACLLWAIPFSAALADQVEEGLESEHNLAPYFQVTGENDGAENGLDRLPLKETRATVRIVDVIAEVELKQVFANAGDRPIEATYVFPASTGTAVHGMEMRIGERVITARIEEKGQAKATYEKAKSDGKSAALLEEHRPNVFQTSVANILPGDTIEVTLRYSEILRATDSIYEFVFPTTVGPRYTNVSTGSPDAPQHAFVENPYLTEGEPSSADFGLDLSLAAALPIASVRCPSHPTRLEFLGAREATLAISGAEAATRDVIVRYQLAGKELLTGLTLHEAEGEEENFFLLNLQPPTRVRPDQVPPREYTFIVDVSGSMRGFPLDLAKDLFRDLAEGLREEDFLNVMRFAGASEVLASEPLPATRKNIRRALAFLGESSGNGGTELIKALDQAVHLPGSESRSRSILVITDGFVSMEADAFQLIREELGSANLFAFGIGSSVNRHLIEGMARVGGGEPFVVTHPDEAEETARRLREYIESPVLTNISIEAEGFDIRELEPRSHPDVFAQRPLTVVGKWKGKPEGLITVTGLTGGGEEYCATIDVAQAVADSDSSHPALRPLWARERVRGMADYAKLSKDNEAVKEVTNLGLTYDLLTPFTSFVAVDEVVRLGPGGEKATPVKQPTALPQGVGNSAVGGTVPEPGAGLLLLIAALATLGVRRRPTS